MPFMQQLQLSAKSQSGLIKKKEKSYAQKAMEASGYLFELLDDAIDYKPLETVQDQKTLCLKVLTNLGTEFTIAISFSRSEIRLKPQFPSGILQTECQKIRHFMEDLECYMNVAHQWR